MKTYCFVFIVFIVINLLLARCAKPVEPELQKPRLFITLKDDSGRSVSAATVRLYKNVNYTGIRKISYTAGVLIFSELDTTLYYWLAEKACITNRTSQTTLDRPLIPGAILYGYSVMFKTGTLKIINNSIEPYNVSDSIYNLTINKDTTFTIYKGTPYVAYRRAGSYLLHIEKVSTPGIGKDTLVKVKCGDTTILNIPY